MTDQISKQAGLGSDFISGALDKLKDDLNFRTKPFETIFGIFGPVIVARFSPLLSALVIAADMFTGYGPSALGKMIDEKLMSGTAKDVSEIDFSDSNLQQTSTSIVDEIWSGLKSLVGMESKSALKEILTIKGNISNNDVLVASYVGEQTLYKKALFGRYKSYGWGNRSRTRLLGSFLSSMKSGRRLGFANIIFGLLKSFGKGILMLGAAGGIARMVGVKTRKEKEREGLEGGGFIPGSGEGPMLPRGLSRATMQYYSNVSGNIEDTLITFLDAAIANFSVAFRTMYGIPLKGSPQMNRVVQDVEFLNWGNLEEINKRKAFVAPKVLNIAKSILPEAKYERIQSQPLAKKPISTAPETPGEELSGLLQGVR